MTHTLILDEDGVYDPGHFNDRLLLGLKGTMSEAELHILSRACAAASSTRRAAANSRCRCRSAWSMTTTRELCSMRIDRSRTRSRLLFDTFRETGSACAVVRRLRGQKILFPRRIRRGIGKGDLLWSAIDHSRVLQILHNPRYAGAFAYGRTRTAYNAKLKPVQLRVQKSDWQVLIPDAHVGYISWAEFERNQVTLRAQCERVVARTSVVACRAKAARLLQGRLLCGRCGARMRVHYELLDGQLRPY